jgi:glycosyltransferase involved in cell wall biosynthesis
MKCRLLYLVGSLHTGGLERQLCYLLSHVDRDRYQPAVVAWNHREEDAHVSDVRALNVPIYSFPDAQSGGAKLRSLRDLVSQLRPEVIHSYSFYTNFAAHFAARNARAIAVGSIRSDFTWGIQQCGPVLGRLSARWPSNQICNSASAAECARSVGRFFVPARIRVVRNAIDLQRFPAWPVPNGQPARILGVGELSAVKRWDLLIRAAGQLKQIGVECLVTIAGEGACRAALEQQIATLGLGDRVELVGHVGNISALLSAAQLLVHTAAAEGCPNAVMEAMACGRPVVAPSVGDIPQLVEHGKTGLMVPPLDERALVEGIATLVGNHDLCVAMGRAGRAKAEMEFGLDRLVDETLHAYRSAGWIDN